jgi:hypothetical protein
MPDPTKISIVELWKYEKSVFLKACHETSKGSFGRGFIVGILALIGQYAAGLRSEHDIALMVLISLGAAVLVLLGEFAFKLLRAPAKLAKELEGKIESDRILEEKIQVLSDTKKEQERAEFIKKYTKIILANQLQNLETRISEIGNLSGIAYKNSKKEGKDIVTNELVDRISSFLKENISPDSAILFTSKTGATYTPVPAWAYPQPDERERFATIDNLNHFAAQLKEIIKNH